MYGAQQCGTQCSFIGWMDGWMMPSPQQADANLWMLVRACVTFVTIGELLEQGVVVSKTAQNTKKTTSLSSVSTQSAYVTRGESRTGGGERGRGG